MSFDKIEFVKPNDILQGGFNPNLPAEISVTEQLLYSIANNLAILNNNLINSGALQNLALLGDLMQEVFTDDRTANKKHSVFESGDRSVFVSDFIHHQYGDQIGIGLATLRRFINEKELWFWGGKSTGAVVNNAASTYSFNVPVPTVSVSSSPATVNVSASAPVVNNNIPVPSVTNQVNVASAVPDITVNATAPIVNNNVPVPSVTNEVTVQSSVPDITVNATAPTVNNNIPVPSVSVSSSPATVNVSATAPIVNNNIPVPSVSVSSSPATVNVSSTAPVVNVSSSPAQIEFDSYDDADLISKLNEVKETLETALMSEVETDIKMGLADIVFERDNINLIDYPVEMLTEPASTKKLREF